MSFENGDTKRDAVKFLLKTIGWLIVVGAGGYVTLIAGILIFSWSPAGIPLFYAAALILLFLVFASWRKDKSWKGVIKGIAIAMGAAIVLFPLIVFGTCSMSR